MINGLPAIPEGPDNLQIGNTESTEEDTTGGVIYDGVSGETDEPEGNLESVEIPKTSLEWDSHIEWNQTIVLENYTVNCRRDYSQEQKDCRKTDPEVEVMIFNLRIFYCLGK